MNANEDTVRKVYQKEIFDELGYFSAWHPSNQVELGDFRFLKDYRFQSIANLKKFDIESKKHSSKDARTTIKYSSKGIDSEVIDLSANATGNDVLTASLCLKLYFKEENGIYLNIDKASTEKLKELLFIKEAIVKLHKEGKWDFDYVFVSEVIHSDNATVLIAKDKNSSVQLKLNGRGNLPVEDVSKVAVKSNIGYEIDGSKNLNLELVSETNLTPLFKLSRIKRTFLTGKTIFDNRLFYPEPDPVTGIIGHDEYHEVFEIEEIKTPD